MLLNKRLIPISFHLRNFNKYLQLDLKAADAGNLTFIGENAAGKTTLANCFFPMLIDGSITTPSFNPAKGTDKLANKKPRNSSRDMRTFESMLLGWGSGAMKARTGYSYLNLRSDQRAVILGLGAHRAEGDQRKPTWWFVVMSTDVNKQLAITTCDKDGSSLNLAEFKLANQNLGDQLRVFDHSEDYRDYVATTVYGFTEASALTKLVSVYQLLASPILTAGNARFTPIREALKNAQESIDPQIMINVAQTQRDVNRMNGMLLRIKQGQIRLQRIQKTVFWGNLNHLNEIIIVPYNKQALALERKKTACENELQRIKEFEQQLVLLTGTLEQAVKDLDVLKEIQIKQKTLVRQRTDFQRMIDQLTTNLNSYHNQLQNIRNTQQQLTTAQQRSTEIKQQQKNLRDQKIRPLLAQMSALVEQLPGLNEVLGAMEISEIIQHLSTYLRENQRAIAEYQSNQLALEHMGNDVQIVSEMQMNLDTKIDQRASGALFGRFREGLHQDNHEVHSAGASKMNQGFETLTAQQKKLLSDFLALQQFLKHPDLLDALTAGLEKLRGLEQQSVTLVRDLNSQDKQVKFLEKQLQDYQKQITQDFDEQQVTTQIEKYQADLAALKIDPTIDERVQQAKQQRNRLTAQSSQLESQKAEQQGRLKIDSADQQRYQKEVIEWGEQLMTAIKNLTTYASIPVDFSSIMTVLAFCKQNRAEIRNNSYSGMVSKIDRLIHNSGSDGIDHNALDDLFEERGHLKIATAMQHERTQGIGDLTTVSFDYQQAVKLLATDENAVTKALRELNSGNDFAQTTYLSAATQRITAQYKLIENYNEMLTAGVGREQSIKLKVGLTPTEVTPELIAEARNPLLADQRPLLMTEIKKRLEKLANDTTIADSEDDFMIAAQQLLDTRQWSEFQILIKRRQSAEDEYEVVDDKFVQSGGSGAEKAQAMVLPLLLVPKMVLQRATKEDAPYLVMFDEFADKLDPETAKSFAKTIARFGFNFIATMPEGAQNKILADGVANVAYDVIAAKDANDGRFHPNTVVPALVWQLEVPDEPLS